MTEHSPESVLSALLKLNASSGNAQGLVDAMLTIQTQLSVIQENQRKIMRTLREIKIEQRTRLSDLKKSTQGMLKDSHRSICDQLNEIQDSVDEQNIDDEDAGEFEMDLFK